MSSTELVSLGPAALHRHKHEATGAHAHTQQLQPPPHADHHAAKPAAADAASSSSSPPVAAATAAVSHTLQILLHDAQGNAAHQPPFPTNEITTSKYHWWNFLPLNLMEQFRRFANMYFLVITILQGIPAISPFPIYTSLVPLCFILFVSALKEALEDISRHRADELANSRRFLVMMDKQERQAAREAEAAEAAKNGAAHKHATAGGVLENRGRSGSGQAVLAPGMNKQSVLSSSRGEPADHAGSSHHMHRRSPSMLFPNPDGSAAESASSYFRVLSSKQIRVGQILLVRKDEEFPADLLLLSAASQDATCFVNTANLDGEAVPKVRAAPACTMHLVTPAAIDSLQGTVVVEKPSASMYRFQGRVQLDAKMQSASAAAAAKKAGTGGGSGAAPHSIFNDAAGINAKLSQLQTDDLSTPSKPRRISGPPSPASRGSARGSRRGSGSHAAKLIDGHYHYPINDQQLLLRGSKLVNTAWVFGCVIYTGRESKLMLNRSAPKFKFSKFEQQLNKFVVMLFLFNLMVCLALAAGFVMRSQKFSDVFGISPSSSGVGFLLNFLTQYILFSFMIPMSLYVTIELVKVGQAKFMEWDTRMMYWDPEGGGGPDGTQGMWKAMVVKNSSICEELGNLDYIFSDKTGTLTQNKMELTAVSVGGVLFKDTSSLTTANVAANAAAANASNRDATAAATTDTKTLHPSQRFDFGAASGSGGGDRKSQLSLPPLTVDDQCTAREHYQLSPTGGKIYLFSAAAPPLPIIYRPHPSLALPSSSDASSGQDPASGARAVALQNPNAANHSPLTISQPLAADSQAAAAADDVIRAPARKPSGASSPPPQMLRRHSSAANGNGTGEKPPSSPTPLQPRPSLIMNAAPLSPGSPNVRVTDEDGVVTRGTRSGSMSLPPLPVRPRGMSTSSPSLAAMAATETAASSPQLKLSKTPSLPDPSPRSGMPSDPTSLHTDFVLQDLVNRAFASLTSAPDSYPRDSIELDYLLDLLLCNSVQPLAKKKSKPRAPNGEIIDDSDSSDDEDDAAAAVALPLPAAAPELPFYQSQPLHRLESLQEEDTGALSPTSPLNAGPSDGLVAPRTPPRQAQYPTTVTNANASPDSHAALNGATGAGMSSSSVVASPASAARVQISYPATPGSHAPVMTPGALAKAIAMQYTFSSSSPDEIALCESLDRCGLTMTDRKGAIITLRYTPAPAVSARAAFAAASGSNSSAPQSLGVRFFRFTIRATLDFTSTRARMDVVATTPDGTTKIFVKGSDQQVLKMVTASAAKQKDAATATPSAPGAAAAMDASALIELTGLQLSAFAKTGSRTLLMAGRTLSASQASSFLERFNEAANSLLEREHEIESAFKSLETGGLSLLGASAVEDQLQEGVSESVDFMLKGGLKLIILTGDRLETAVTIGHQSRLLQPHMSVLQIGASHHQDNIQAMLLENIRIVTAAPPTDSTAEQAAEARIKYAHVQGMSRNPVEAAPGAPMHGYALAIDGHSLEVCLTHFPDEFLLLFLHTATIIAYRSTPKQKALAVRIVKEGLGRTTLAIGDGANDVSMIQEANVGVGILGKEGSHAALSSDYIIYRFKQLLPLLFLQGRYSYYRTSKVVFYSFYKNMVFPLPMVLFSFWSYNSGQVFYIPILMSVFNLFCTSLPPLLTGWYERDVPESVLLVYPAAYSDFKKHTIFTTRVFLGWMAEGMYQGFVLWFVMYALLSSTISSQGGSETVYRNGQDADLWLEGMIVFFTMVTLTNLKMLTSLRFITIFSVLASALGVVALLLILAVISQRYFESFAPNAFGLLGAMFSTHITWLYLGLCLGLAYMPSLAFRSYWDLYHPSRIQVMTERESLQRAEKIANGTWIEPKDSKAIPFDAYGMEETAAAETANAPIVYAGNGLAPSGSTPTASPIAIVAHTGGGDERKDAQQTPRTPSHHSKHPQHQPHYQTRVPSPLASAPYAVTDDAPPLPASRPSSRPSSRPNSPQPIIVMSNQRRRSSKKNLPVTIHAGGISSSQANTPQANTPASHPTSSNNMASGMAALQV